MKGSTVRTLLKGLRGKRLDGFLAHLKQHSNGHSLAAVAAFLHGSSNPTDLEVMQRFGLSKGQYFHWLEAIGDQSVEFIAGKGPSALKGRTYDIARTLIDDGENDAATDFIRLAIKEAASFEDFDTVLRFWQLAASIQPRPVIDAMSEGEAKTLRKNLIAYEELMDDFQAARKIVNAEHRFSVIRQLLASELLCSESMPLSARARYFFLKLNTAHLLIRDFQQGFAHQSRLVSFLESNSSVIPSHEWELVRELCILAWICGVLKLEDVYQETIDRIFGLNLKTAKAEKERASFVFPTRIGKGVRDGNQQLVYETVESFLGLFDSSKSLDSRTATTCLYWCLYGAIASKDLGLRRKVIRHLSQFSKADFDSQFYSMYRFLEVIVALEDSDFEQALRYLKNRLRRQSIEEISGMKGVLSFLVHLVSRWEADPRSRRQMKPEVIETVVSLTTSSMVLDYFDLAVWLDSQRMGCSMLEAIQHQAANP